MNSELFLKTHRETWNRLNRLLEQMNQAGPSGLNERELAMLGALFRRVTAHLVYAQSNYAGHEMIAYLNNLVVKAHGQIYRQENLSTGLFWEFFRRGFPRLIREQGAFIIAAGVLMLLGIVTGYVLHFYQPALDGFIIPDNIKKMVGDGLNQGKAGADWPMYTRPVISTAIMLNNIKVGLVAFALGLSWGIGTVLILFKNGLLIGVLGAIFTSHDHTLDFWSLILPHGILELTAIFICGGAGLVLAKALVKPGLYRRSDALKLQGKIALKLVMGTIPLFVVAALIEGFITPSTLPNYLKLIVAAGTLAAFLVYMLAGNGGLGRKAASGR